MGGHMNIDFTLVNKFLNDHRFGEIENHWLFNNIENGEHLFELPNVSQRKEVKIILELIQKNLSDFKPLNENIFTAIYPEWPQIIGDMNVLLVVGCPEPYDAMVKEYGGTQYVIFDLIRLNNYVKLGYNIDSMINQLLTHEISHLCLHQKYPVPTSSDYFANLKYIVFDEAFAHILSFNENIAKYDFTKIIEKHYSKSLVKLRSALKESDNEKQNELLIKANSGLYWDKFGSISGKLFLARNKENIVNIYSKGVDNLIQLMGLTP